MITSYKTDRDQSCDICITVSTDLSEMCRPNYHESVSIENECENDDQ